MKERKTGFKHQDFDKIIFTDHIATRSAWTKMYLTGVLNVHGDFNVSDNNIQQ